MPIRLVAHTAKTAAASIDARYLFDSCIHYLAHNKIATPKYYLLQQLVSSAINNERERLGDILANSVSASLASMSREETSKYTDPLKNEPARMFSVVMDARSAITTPTYPQTLEKGWHEIRGLAWSGRGKIRAVEVSSNGGRTWDIANLQGPILPKAHTYFSLP